MNLISNIFQIFIVISTTAHLYTVNSMYEYCEKSSKQPHARLKEDVLCDYDPLIRPKLDHKNTTTISAKLLLKSFSYDMYSHVLSINTWTTLLWSDDHLKWKPENYEGIESTHFSTDLIWTPDLSHYNRHEQDGSHEIINDISCHVTYIGRVICLSPGKYDNLCTADLRSYPYDTQTCTFILGSWVHTGEELNLEFLNDGISLQELTANPEWDLINVTYIRSRGEDGCCPNSTFPSLIYVFVLERRGGFIEATAVIPSLGLLTMTLWVLFLNAKESERITLIVCNILSHIMYLQYISWHVPSFGDNVPKIILFGRDSMVIVFFELIITILLRNLSKSPEESSNWAMEVVSKVVGSRLGHTILVLDFTMKNVAKVKKEEDGENIIDNIQPDVAKDCALFAKIVDRLCFVLFVLAYFIMIILFIV